MNEPTTVEEPAVELFEYKHPKTHKTITLPKILKTERGDVDFQGLLEATIEKSKMDAKTKMQERYAEIEAKASEYDVLKERLNELETTGLTAQQKASKEAERVAADLKRAKDEAERYRNSLFSERVSNALYSEFGKVKGIVDINKAATLFKAECNPRLVEKNGEYFTMADYDGQELLLSEAHAKWIARDDNKFLLQNTLSPGGGSTGGNSSMGAKQKSRADFDALGPTERMAFITDGGKVV